MLKNIINRYFINGENNVDVKLDHKQVTLIETYDGINIYAINDRMKDGYLAICTDYNQPDGYLYTIMDKDMYENININNDKKREYFNNIKKYCNTEHMMHLYNKFILGDININMLNIYHFNIFVSDDIKKIVIEAYNEDKKKRKEKEEMEMLQEEKKRECLRKNYIADVRKRIKDGDLVQMDELFDVIKVIDIIPIKTTGAIKKHLNKYQLNRSLVWYHSSDKIAKTTKQSIYNALITIMNVVHDEDENEAIPECDEKELNHLFNKG